MSSNGLGARTKDTAGLATYILDNLGHIEKEFYERLVDQVAQRSDIDLTRDPALRALAVKKLRQVADGGKHLVMLRRRQLVNHRAAGAPGGGHSFDISRRVLG